MNLSTLPSCWASLSPVEREECREILDLVATKPPGPVELRAMERLAEILDGAAARDRKLWHVDDPALPTLLSEPNTNHLCTPTLT